MLTVRLTPGGAAAILDAGFMTAAWLPVMTVLATGTAAIVYVPATVGAAFALGLYRREAIAARGASLGRLPVAAGFGGLAVLIGLAVLPRGLHPSRDAAALFPAAFASFLLAGALSRVVLRVLRREGWFRFRVLVFGAGARAWDLAFLLRREGRHIGYDLTFVHERSQGEPDLRLHAEKVVQLGNQSLVAVARDTQADTIVVAPDERRGMRLEALMECKIAGFPVQEYLGFLERELRRVDLKRLDMSWLIYGDGFFASPLDRVLKRGGDAIVSLALLTLLAPVLLAAMLAVLLDDGWPVFYRQERVTLNGARFHILKLRTMRRDAEARGAVWAAHRDPRITRIGAILRRTRLDELPQLINVLAGSMSLVGPRPERPEFVATLARQIPLYHERHAVKAGLTGWAQINYPYGASIDDARSKLSYDLYYIKKFGFLLDVLIVAQTIRAVIWPSGAR